MDLLVDQSMATTDSAADCDITLLLSAKELEVVLEKRKAPVQRVVRFVSPCGLIYGRFSSLHDIFWVLFN